MSSIALANTPDAHNPAERADFVIGTLEGAAADSAVIEIFKTALEQQTNPANLRVVCDEPYKGGYITQRHADPDNGVHVLQLEIKKKLYMHEGLTADEPNAFLPNQNFQATKTLLQQAFKETRDTVYSLLS